LTGEKNISSTFRRPYRLPCRSKWHVTFGAFVCHALPSIRYFSGYAAINVHTICDHTVRCQLLTCDNRRRVKLDVHCGNIGRWWSCPLGRHHHRCCCYHLRHTQTTTV